MRNGKVSAGKFVKKQRRATPGLFRAPLFARLSPSGLVEPIVYEPPNPVKGGVEKVESIANIDYFL